MTDILDPPIDSVSDPHLEIFATLLAQQREVILDRWLAAASAQPFHTGRPTEHILNHLPLVLDALIGLLRRPLPNPLESGALPEDDDVMEKATAHASRRFEQGLRPSDVVTEFRMLRQEIGRAIWDHLPEDTPSRAAGHAEMVVHDALDGATKLALTALVRQIEEVREEILATTMHEVRQPITSIKGGIQLARRKLLATTPDLSAATDSLSRAEVATDQMMLILNRLGYVSRLALSRLELDATPTDLEKVVRDALRRLEAEEAQHVTVDVAPDTGTIGDWDNTALGQVVSNLLSNAIKYSPPASPILVRIDGEDDKVHLTVTDRGIGLEPGESAQLFRRYARASGAVEEGITGIGLGLYIVRGIVEAHGGTIWAESAGRGTGSTFHVAIPRTLPARPSPNESVSAA